MGSITHARSAIAAPVAIVALCLAVVACGFDGNPHVDEPIDEPALTIGADATFDEFAIGPARLGGASPSIAWNGTKFVVVWTGERGTQLVHMAANGVIEEATATVIAPDNGDVAVRCYRSLSGTCVVVWRAAGGEVARVARFRNGAAIDATPFEIAATGHFDLDANDSEMVIVADTAQGGIVTRLPETGPTHLPITLWSQTGQQLAGIGCTGDRCFIGQREPNHVHELTIVGTVETTTNLLLPPVEDAACTPTVCMFAGRMPGVATIMLGYFAVTGEPLDGTEPKAILSSSGRVRLVSTGNDGVFLLGADPVLQGVFARPDTTLDPSFVVTGQQFPTGAAHDVDCGASGCGVAMLDLFYGTPHVVAKPMFGNADPAWLSLGVNRQLAPQIASHGDGYLVTWTETRVREVTLRGIRLDARGIATQSASTVYLTKDPFQGIDEHELREHALVWTGQHYLATHATARSLDGIIIRADGTAAPRPIPLMESWRPRHVALGCHDGDCGIVAENDSGEVEAIVIDPTGAARAPKVKLGQCSLTTAHPLSIVWTGDRYVIFWFDTRSNMRRVTWLSADGQLAGSTIVEQFPLPNDSTATLVGDRAVVLYGDPIPRLAAIEAPLELATPLTPVREGGAPANFVVPGVVTIGELAFAMWGPDVDARLVGRFVVPDGRLGREPVVLREGFGGTLDVSAGPGSVVTVGSQLDPMPDGATERLHVLPVAY